MPGKKSQKFTDYLSERAVPMPMWFYYIRVTDRMRMTDRVSAAIGAFCVAMFFLFSEEQAWSVRFLKSYAISFFSVLCIMIHEQQQKMVMGFNDAAVMASDILEDFESAPELEAIKSKLGELEDALAAALADDLSSDEGQRSPSPAGSEDTVDYSSDKEEGKKVISKRDAKIQELLINVEKIKVMVEILEEEISKNLQLSCIQKRYYQELCDGLKRAVNNFNYRVDRNDSSISVANVIFRKRIKDFLENIRYLTSNKFCLKFIIKFLVKDRYSNHNFSIIMLSKLLDDKVLSALVGWVEQKNNSEELQQGQDAQPFTDESLEEQRLSRLRVRSARLG
jgi:hypothetical protein